MAKLKTLKHKYCFSLDTCHKYVVQFKGPTHIIFWYVTRAKLTFLNIPILHTIQEKHCSRFCACLKRDVEIIDQTCTIHRPVEKNLKSS